jgi:FKBP-type peptidyl-prolyl cis-trans isomerase FklB
MKNFSYLSLSILFFWAVAVCAGTDTEETAALDSDEQKSSYALAVQYMTALKNDDLQLDNAAFMQGLQDVQNGRELRLNGKENQKALDHFLGIRTLNHNAKIEKQLTEIKTFLEQNKNQAGVITLASGLQYKVLQTGNAEKSPTQQDGVSIHFVISDLHGQELGRSINDKPQTALFNGMIPGWKEALLLMKPGDRWQLFISPNLAYGTQGSPNKAVKPNAAIITDMELVAIVPAEAAKAAIEKAAE